MDVNSLFRGALWRSIWRSLHCLEVNLEVNSLFGGQFGGPVALFGGQFGGPVGTTKDRTVKGGHLEVGISSMAAERQGHDRYDGGLWGSY